ncbi:MAG: LysM peptidoglycan-binding domain-containing protein [Chloroflexi bacterium]|nr:MAG: LysM peptidoglycan-binding domain-containing protein [Chloroflexota bacterium]MBL1194782.1 LysM peptidoglycan-binding domain-containing protein [Chloroflexota bacterium]NOH12074.1 phosphotransferase [Chloroflexota bacterium]
MRKLLISLVFAAFVLPIWQVSASPSPEPGSAPLLTPSQIISGINSYRAANGLPSYQSNSTLMQLAQGQADYQASIETVTHTGPGGTRPIDRAYSIGYGNGNTVFVSEIIYGGYTATVDIAITWWKGSSIHNSTMLASTYQEIGAGVASSGDRMFFTAVTGYVVGAPAPENAGVPIVAGDDETSTESEAPSVPSIIIIPVTKSEPREDGSIIHTVRTGQALWNIAAVYDVPLEELLEINNLPQNAIIFSGDEIIVQEATEPVVEVEPTTDSQIDTPEPTEAVAPTIAPTEAAAIVEEATADEAEVNTSASAVAALPPAEQPGITGFFQGSTARWIMVIAFVGLLGVLGTSLVMQQRTVETATVTGNLDPLTTPLNVALSSESQEEKQFEELPRKEQFEHLQRLGEVALMTYDLKIEDIKPHNHWLNASFKLLSASEDGADNPDYLLRIHHPKLHTAARVRSEMQWLAHLREHADLQAPEPIKNIEDKWVTMMDAPGVPEKRACTILTWPSGKQLTAKQVTQKKMGQVGAWLARLHEAGQEFDPPKGFTRPKWDWAGLQGKAFNVKRDAARADLSDEQLEILDAAKEQIKDTMGQLEKRKNALGLIHGNLGVDNLVFDGDEAKATDFAASGWGYYVYDLAVTLHSLANRDNLPKLETALLKGYRNVRPLPDEEATNIKTLMAGRSMSQVYLMTALIDQPAFHKQAEERIQEQFDYLATYLI